MQCRCFESIILNPQTKKMTFSGRNCYNLIICSNVLCNCIFIGAYDTNKQIKEKIDMQIKISKM